MAIILSSTFRKTQPNPKGQRLRSTACVNYEIMVSMNRIPQIDAELRELELRRVALEAERGKLIAAEREDSGSIGTG